MRYLARYLISFRPVNRVIILNIILIIFFIIINKNENFKFQKIKNLINRIFIKVNRIINIYFDILIIVINIIYLLIDIYFKYIDLDFFIIIILLENLIF